MVLGRHDVALDQQGADEGRRRLAAAGLASAEFHENCPRLGEAVLRGQGLGETDQRRELAGAGQQGVVPTVLRRDRVAGILRDPGELGCRPRIPGRRASAARGTAAPPRRTGPRHAGRGPCRVRPSRWSAARPSTRCQWRKARSVRPRSSARRARAMRSSIAVSPASIACGQGCVRGLGVVRARQAAGERRPAASPAAGRQRSPCARRRRHRPSAPGRGRGRPAPPGPRCPWCRPAAGAPAPPRRPGSGPATRRQAAGAAG